MRDAKLLLEQEMVSPWFDASGQFFQPHTSGASQLPPQPSLKGHGRTLLLILSPPRSGSYHLCRLLWQLGYGKPTEYFNPLLSRALRRFGRPSNPVSSLVRHSFLWLRRHLPERSGFRVIGIAPALPDRTWLQNLVLERSARSKLSGQLFFSAKLQAHQLGRVSTALRRDFAPLSHQGFWKPFRLHPPKLVLLFRRDLARSVASFHFSLCSGSFDQGRIFSYQHRPLQQMGDRRALLTDLAAYRVHLEWLVDALTTCPYPIHGLTFEDLLTDQDRQLDGLLRVIDPVEESEEKMNRSELLNFRIARAERSEAVEWNQQRQNWLAHLEDQIHHLQLLNHPEGRRAQELIHILSEGCLSLPLRNGSGSSESTAGAASKPNSSSGYH